MAERYRHLERSVSATATPEQVLESQTIARWIGLAFGEMSGLRATLESEYESQRADRELARAIARGHIQPGGTDYMEADSEEFGATEEVEP